MFKFIIKKISILISNQFFVYLSSIFKTKIHIRESHIIIFSVMILFITGCHSMPMIPSAKVLNNNEAEFLSAIQVDGEWFAKTGIPTNEPAVFANIAAEMKWGLGHNFDLGVKFAVPSFEVGLDGRYNFVNLSDFFLMTFYGEGGISLATGVIRGRCLLISSLVINNVFYISPFFGITSTKNLDSNQNNKELVLDIIPGSGHYLIGTGTFVDFGLVLDIYPINNVFGIALEFEDEYGISGTNTNIILLGIIIHKKV